MNKDAFLDKLDVRLTDPAGIEKGQSKRPGRVRSAWLAQEAGVCGCGALIDSLLCLQELLNLTRFVFSALGFAFSLCTLLFLTSLLLKFGLGSPPSFGVDKSFWRVHQSPFFSAPIFGVSQKNTLAHIVYVGLIWFSYAPVPQERNAVSCGEAADG
ncbi:MAG: hypothetical protein WBZ25_15800 [Pseudolabrys sp.]